MIYVVDSILDISELILDLDAVIFDLDDTLYSEKEYIRSGYREIAKYFPNIRSMEAKLWQAFVEKKQAVNEVLLAEGCFNEETLSKCLAIYREHIPRISLYSGVRTLLERIRQQNKLMGIITDGRPDGQHNKIHSLDLERLVDVIIITDELGGVACRKPNPISFIQMQQCLEVPFEKMCYIADNIAKDFQAPEALNMRCIWVQNPDGLYFNKQLRGQENICL